MAGQRVSSNRQHRCTDCGEQLELGLHLELSSLKHGNRAIALGEYCSGCGAQARDVADVEILDDGIVAAHFDPSTMGPVELRINMPTEISTLLQWLIIGDASKPVRARAPRRPQESQVAPDEKKKPIFTSEPVVRTPPVSDPLAKHRRD